MGQKVNSIIFRSGLKNSESRFKYIEKNSEESSIFLYKNIEIQNYINKIFKNYNIYIKDCNIEHTETSINIFISYFEFKHNNKSLYKNNLENTKKKETTPIIQNIKNLITYLLTKILTLSTNNYLKNKTTNIKTQDLIKKFELKLNTNSKLMIEYKAVFKSLKRFLKDPFQKNLIKLLFIVISERNSSKLLADIISIYLVKNKKKHNYLYFLLKNVINKLINTKFSKIKGVKIVIKGRFNGVPRAKKKNLTIGSVSLQSLTSNIDYHNSTAFTQNGTFGIKVWICEKF